MESNQKEQHEVGKGFGNRWEIEDEKLLYLALVVLHFVCCLPGLLK